MRKGKKGWPKAIPFCMMAAMDLYRVQDAYIEYLYTIDPKVLYNKSRVNQRPYVGVVFHLGNLRYLAPLTSHKPKHERYASSDPRWFKVFQKGDREKPLALLLLSNMIPVVDSRSPGSKFPLSQTGIMPVC